MQEDEGATIGTEELEHKLRLAEHMSDYFYGKRKELGMESNEEQSGFLAVSQKMDSVSNELQEAIEHIHTQAQSDTTANTHARMLNDENRAMGSNTDQLQARLLALQDGNTNTLKRAELERERERERDSFRRSNISYNSWMKCQITCE